MLMLIVSTHHSQVHILKQWFVCCTALFLNFHHVIRKACCNISMIHVNKSSLKCSNYRHTVDKSSEFVGLDCEFTVHEAL